MYTKPEYGYPTDVSETRFRKRSTLSYLAASASLIATMCSVPQLSAQELGSDAYLGGKARVNRALQLSSLTETIAAASCRVGNDFAPDVAADELTEARNSVAAILAGLRDGNTALGIPSPETSSVGIKSIQALDETWTEVDQATAALLADHADQANLDRVGQTYQAMFERTEILGSDISGVHSDPLELLQSDAITLSFIGRQRTLLNKMDRIVCGLVAGNQDFGTVEELSETLSLFENTLSALREGFPNAGISPPPNDTVTAELTHISDDWTAGKSAFDGFLNGAGDADGVMQVRELTRTLATEVINTITLYLIATPGQEGIYRVPVTAYGNDELSQWLQNDGMIEAILAQNDAHATLTEPDIIALDDDWRAQAADGGGPLISQLLSSDVSEWLRDQQANTNGLVTEVFIMDNRGLNVAQSVETSDYWQGDEAKWQETFASDGNEMHIAEIEFDDSTGFYQTQISMPIIDSETNSKIGAITFGINVQGLM